MTYLATYNLQVYLAPLLSSCDTIQNLGLVYLKNQIKSLLLVHPYQTDLITFRDSLTSAQAAAKCIIETLSLSEIAEIWHSNYKIPISPNKRKIIIGGHPLSDYKVDIETSFTIEYLVPKGFLIQENPIEDCQCKYIEYKCQVYKHQIFEVPDFRVDIVNVLDFNTLIISVNNQQLTCNEGNNFSLKSSTYWITAVFQENQWQFEGKFFKFIHTTKSVNKRQYSPKILIPIQRLRNEEVCVYTKYESFKIKVPWVN